MALDPRISEWDNAGEADPYKHPEEDDDDDFDDDDVEVEDWDDDEEA